MLQKQRGPANGHAGKRYRRSIQSVFEAARTFDTKTTLNHERISDPLEGRSNVDRRLAALVLTFAPFSLHAHPHAWIDVRNTIIMSADGLISAIEQEWLFDNLYSSAVLEGLANESPEKKAVASHFAAEVIENLDPYGYSILILNK